MKIIELTNRLNIVLDNEEAALLEKFDTDAVAKNQLTEREQVLANQLTVKDVLLRTNEEGQIYYTKRI